VVPAAVVATVVIALLISATPGHAQLNRTMHDDGWILAAARAPGLHGSIWRTDLWIHVESVYPETEVLLYFCRSGRDNTDVEPVPVPLDPAAGQEIYYFEDVIRELLGVTSGSWVGAIHYTGNAPLQVWARIYSISADGSESYGQLVEGIPTSDMSPPWMANSHEQQWIFAAKHTADDRYRVNVGVMNPTAVEGNFAVQMYDGTGNNPPGGSAWEPVTVPPFSMVQLTDPFADVNGGEWNNMEIRVMCETEGGGGFGYASVVDNATNDAYFVRGVKKQWVGQ
jgi:hypothetical protein